jgi:hypothetical protein
MLTVRNLLVQELERRSGARKSVADEPYLLDVHEYAPGKYEATAMWRVGQGELDATAPWVRTWVSDCESADQAERRVLAEVLCLPGAVIQINLTPAAMRAELPGGEVQAMRTRRQTRPRASVRNADARGASPTLLARIDALCVPVPFCGCHVFLGQLNEHGYPLISNGKRRVKAHRAVLEAKIGRKLPRKVFACHECDVRACCNPDHLFPGSNKANVKDKCAKGRQARVPSGGVRMNLERARELRALRDQLSLAELSARYGISVRQVGRIAAGQRWPEPMQEAAE